MQVCRVVTNWHSAKCVQLQPRMQNIVAFCHFITLPQANVVSVVAFTHFTIVE